MQIFQPVAKLKTMELWASLREIVSRLGLKLRLGQLVDRKSCWVTSQTSRLQAKLREPLAWPSQVMSNKATFLGRKLLKMMMQRA